MKTLFAGLLCIGLTTSVFGQGTLDAITFPEGTDSAPGFVAGGVGWSFSPTTNISVTEVGALVFDDPVSVRVWQNTDVLINTYNFDATNPGTVRYTSITPLLLLAGNTYSISLQGGTLSSNVIFRTFGVDNENFSPFVVSPLLANFSNQTINSNGVWTATPASPMDSQIFFLGGTFRFVPVPEPSSFALLLGVVAAWYPIRALRRKRR